MAQQRMAELLGIGQDGISRIEKRSDLLISTLRNYIARMGGELELVARFPDRPPVLLQDLAELSPPQPRRRGRSLRAPGHDMCPPDASGGPPRRFTRRSSVSFWTASGSGWC
jgi:hypothetical protein